MVSEMDSRRDKNEEVQELSQEEDDVDSEGNAMDTVHIRNYQKNDMRRKIARARR